QKDLLLLIPKTCVIYILLKFPFPFPYLLQPFFYCACFVSNCSYGFESFFDMLSSGYWQKIQGAGKSFTARERADIPGKLLSAGKRFRVPA
ncbi:MAG: hypothetical protein Q4D81_10005, partial [Eubacteriales bacterium]|nr:hypothetical protein [Eubacteriales bacterium]